MTIHKRGFVLLAVMQFLGYVAAAQVVETHEGTLRKLATRVVLPSYPNESVSRGSSGVTVARVVVSSQGKISLVRFLDAPDKDIESAVREAVEQWTFKETLVEGRPIVITSRLTFYFRIKDGKGVVEHPRRFAPQGSTESKGDKP